MSLPQAPSATNPEIFAARPPNQLELLARIDARLERIEGRLAQLDPLIDAKDGLGGLLALAGDSFDDFAAELGDLDDRLRAVLRLAERVSRPETLAQIHAALDLLEAAPGLIAGAQALETRVGLFGALAALREPEVQRALGFAIDVARRFGARVDQLQLPQAP